MAAFNGPVGIVTIIFCAQFLCTAVLAFDNVEAEVSTAESTNSADDKYNISGTSPVADVDSATVSSASVLTSTTVSSTTVKLTTLPGTLPLRPSDVTNVTFDHHVYYNSTMYTNEELSLAYWVNFDTLPRSKAVVHQMLPDSHRRAVTIRLSFVFPFYGHPLRDIAISTGGFVYTGDYLHSWFAATQYIAPLMAKFDSSLSTVRYFDNGTAFVIEWQAATLQDGKRGGNFTFQATLLKNGNIVFVYEILPVSIREIGDDVHPVKVGLSDAYVIDRTLFIRRKTIYEYHRIDMKKSEIGNHTAIYFTALATCMRFRDCYSCMASDCVWCESAKRCSDGLDSLRKNWLQSKCDVKKESVDCSMLPVPDLNPFVQLLTDSPYKTNTVLSKTPKSDYPYETSSIWNMPRKPETRDDNAPTIVRVAEESSSLGVGSVLLILSVVLGGLMWAGYAYKSSHDKLTKAHIPPQGRGYLPSQWRFRSSKARYAAASVYM